MSAEEKSQYKDPKLRKGYGAEYLQARELLDKLKQSLDAFDQARATDESVEVAGAALSAAMAVDRQYEAIPRLLATVLHADHNLSWNEVAEFAGHDTSGASYARWGINSTGRRKRESDRRRRLELSHEQAAEKRVRWLPQLLGESSSTAGRALGCTYMTVIAMGRRGELLRVHFADESGLPLVGPGSSPDRYYIKGVSLKAARRRLAKNPGWTGDLLSAPVLDEDRQRVRAPGGGDQLQYFPELSRFERIERFKHDEAGNRLEPHFMLVIPEAEVQELAMKKRPGKK